MDAQEPAKPTKGKKSPWKAVNAKMINLSSAITSLRKGASTAKQQLEKQTTKRMQPMLGTLKDSATSTFETLQQHANIATGKKAHMFASQSNFELSINVLSPELRVHQGLVLLEKYRRMKDDALPYPLRVVSCTSTDMCFLTRSIFCRILLYIGDIQALSAFAQLNSPLRRMVHAEQPMWKHMIRYVGCDLHVPITSTSSAAAILRNLDSNLRASSWIHFCSADRVKAESPQTFQDYVVLGQAQGKTCKSIDTDIHRTLGQSRSSIHSNHRLENSETNRAMLSAILTAMAGRFPEVGYCQGMDHIAAFLLRHLLHMEDTFWMFVSLFEHYGIKGMFGPDLAQTEQGCYQFRRCFEALAPRLYRKCLGANFIVEMFFIGWFQTLFVYLDVLPTETLDRIWDIFIFEHSWKIMFRVALALVQVIEPKALELLTDGRGVEGIHVHFTSFPDHLEELAPDRLIPRALRIKLTNATLRDLKFEFLNRG